MSNRDKAAATITGAFITHEGDGLRSFGEHAARELEDEGVLADDLPAPDRPGVWYPTPNLDGGIGDVRSGHGKVVVMGLDYKGQPFRLILPADIADEYGRTLQAAADHAQKDNNHE